jgi:hypothetical protein
MLKSVRPDLQRYCKSAYSVEIDTATRYSMVINPSAKSNVKTHLNIADRGFDDEGGASIGMPCAMIPMSP